MKNLSVFVLFLLFSIQALAQVPSKMPGWFYTINLPDDRISVVADGMQEGKFDCSLYGNFSQSEFLTHFAPSNRGPWAELLSGETTVTKLISESLVVRPCLEWETSDGGPDLCLKYDEFEYRFTKTLTTLTFSSAAALHYECNDYNRGREKI